MRIRKPRRHLVAQNRGLDRLCPGASAFKRQKGHRSYASGPMTALAVLREYWQDILIECRSRSLIRGAGRFRDLRSQCHRRQQNANEKSTHHTLFSNGNFVISAASCFKPRNIFWSFSTHHAIPAKHFSTEMSYHRSDERDPIFDRRWEITVMSADHSTF